MKTLNFFGDATKTAIRYHKTESSSLGASWEDRPHVFSQKIIVVH